MGARIIAPDLNTCSRSPLRGETLRAGIFWARVCALVCALFSILAVQLGCSAPAKRVELPAPVESTTVGVGDTFEMQIVGEDKLPTTFTVASDGTGDLPYVKRVKVVGLEPQEIAQLVRAKLMEDQILTDPSVSISIKEYKSKRVEVLGEVQKPGSWPLEPGMTLLRAISVAGGFTTIANKDRVIIRRKVEGKTKASVVSADDIMDNRADDIPLQAGDTIDVRQRAF
jgi:polysaccharide biosynthesis/export protein VpsN